MNVTAATFIERDIQRPCIRIDILHPYGVIDIPVAQFGTITRDEYIFPESGMISVNLEMDRVIFSET